MRKLTLDIDALAVESFATGADADRPDRGTVAGQAGIPTVADLCRTVQTKPTCCPCTPFMAP